MADGARPYDVVVIGGGINGAGIARDAAMRGLAVLLLEQDDFGSGTSSWSSRLIHGGLRYLEHAELSLVYESLYERRRLLQIAPHLVRPLAISIPIYADSRRGPLMLRAGMLLYDLLSLGKALPRHRMLDRESLLAEEPGVNPDGLRGAAQYYDAQATYPERLVVENVLAAAEAGADVRNYSPATAIEIHGGRVAAVRFHDRGEGGEVRVRTRAVVNAAGPWVDRVLARADAPFPRLMGGTRGSHIVVGPFAGAPQNAFYVEARADGRPIFIIPWNRQYLIGTTDIRYDGDPAEARASEAEVGYLLDETNRVFPGAALARSGIHYAYAGVRPLPFRRAGPEAAITRRHIVKSHRDRARGLYSVIGGTLTTYRALAEEVVDRIAAGERLRAAPCRTRDAPLPGGAGLDEAGRRLRELPGMNADTADRLLRVYGSRALSFAERAAAEARPGSLQAALLAAEVGHVTRRELARSLVDIFHRRTMIGLGPDLGRAATARIAALAARTLSWDEGEKARQLAALEAYRLRLACPRGTPDAGEMSGAN